MSNIAFIPVALIAGILAWRAAAVEEPTRRAWRRCAFAFLAWWVGDSLWFLYETVLGKSPFPSPADLGYLAFYPTLLWGLFSFPVVPRSRAARRRVWLDAAVVTVGGMMVVWYLVVDPTVRSAHDVSRLEAALNVAYSVGDLLLVFGVAATLFRSAERFGTPALRLLLLATSLLVVADLTYARLSLSDSYVGGDWPDAFWMVGEVLFIQSAYIHRRGRRRARPTPTVNPGAAPVSVLPYGPMALGFLMLILVGHGSGEYPRVGLVVGAITLCVLVMVRQTGAITESTRLLEVRERELRSSNRLLAAANIRLSEADRSKSAFLATISHELQTPITSIRGFSSFLEGGEQLSGQAADYVSRISRNANALARLVTDLLEFSRLERGEVPLVLEPVSLSSLAPRVVDQLGAVAGRHRIHLAVEPDVTVQADGDAVTRILTNLFSNAVKFSPPEAAIQVRVDTDTIVARLYVADEGPGIPEADRRQVFDLFYRGSHGNSNGTSGMGIGLAVVRELTERMEGWVGVTNGENGGAEFCVSLPLLPNQPPV